MLLMVSDAREKHGKDRFARSAVPREEANQGVECQDPNEEDDECIFRGALPELDERHDGEAK
jgi:hypothetical protein